MYAGVCLSLAAIGSMLWTLPGFEMVRREFYPDEIACVDGFVSDNNFRAGIAEYRDAKVVQNFAKTNITFAQVVPENASHFLWITTRAFVREAYDFALFDLEAPSSQRINLTELNKLNGDPKLTRHCGHWTLYSWGKSKLLVPH
jgi:hypothetical protein